MNKSRIISAIELGSSKITTLIAQIQSDEVGFESTVNILGASSSESRGIKKGQIVDLEEAVEATIASVEGAERMAGYNLNSAFVAINGAHIASQNSHGVVAISDPNGEVTPGDVDRVIEAASAVSLPSSRELIHVIPMEYIVDGESGVKDPIGMTGVRLEVKTHLVTASNAAVRNIQKTMQEVGVQIDELVFSGLASTESVLTRTEKELGCVLVDIGGGTTSVATFIDGSLAYSSVIPIGSNNVTNDLAIGLRVSLESAEKIKRALSEEERKEKKQKPSDGKDEWDLASLGIVETKRVSKKTLIEGIIRPRLNEIFTMVRIQLEKDALVSQVPSGVIVTGGGADVVGIEESAKRMMSLPARIGLPKGVGGLIDDIMQPAYATPIGLILYGIKSVPQENSTSFSKRMKLPTKGIIGKITKAIRDLLP